MTNLTANPNRIDLDEAYLRMAEIWAQRSKANRKQVGALIIRDQQIISDGYNGMPSGDDDDVCEYFDENGQLKTKPEVLHAESNAISKLAANGGLGAEGATLYATMSPCFECAKLIKQAKITRVVFREQYREADGIDFLRHRGVKIEQLVQGEPVIPQSAPAPAPRPAPTPAPAPVPKAAEDDAERLIREFQQMQIAQAAQAPQAPAKTTQTEASYRSSFA